MKFLLSNINSSMRILKSELWIRCIVWFKYAMLIFCIFFIQFYFTNTIYVDQVGKFDWVHRYIGCPHQIERTKLEKSDLIYAATEANVFAALNTSTGDIAWRVVQETNVTDLPMFLLQNEVLVTLSNDGRQIRAWEADTGAFLWERKISIVRIEAVSLSAVNGNVLLLNRESASMFSLKGTEIWSHKIDSAREVIGVKSISETVLLISSLGDSLIFISKVDAKNGTGADELTIKVPFNAKSCSLLHDSLVCYNDIQLFSLDLASNTYSFRSYSIGGIESLVAFDVESFIGIQTIHKTYIYELFASVATELISIDKAVVVSISRSFVGKILLAVVDSSSKITVYDLMEKEQIFQSSFHGSNRAPIAQLKLFHSNHEYEFLTVGVDCRIDFSVGSVANLHVEWSRDEALSTITSVELIDLPLSEAQVNMESEFLLNEGTIFQSFLRRIGCQIKQLKSTIMLCMRRIFFFLSFFNNARSKSFADWISSVRTSVTASRPSKSAQVPLERDYFSLRKIIVISTLKSSLYGLDSSSGSIIWHIYLGEDASPLWNNLGSRSVILYIQRTASHYHHSAQACAIFCNKFTSTGILLIFNPVTGEVISRVDLKSKIKRSELLNFSDSTSLHPLIILDENNRVITYPHDLSNYSHAEHAYFLSFNSSGSLESSALDIRKRQLITLWKCALPLTKNQRIVAVSGKPVYQSVHSAGRVLSDRTVLYKYSNPNLVAFATLDSVHSLLTIYLIDAVSGYIVYAARQSKISSPINMIHCENWLAYSYWNEKYRRTEIGMIELYEGLEQTDEEQFNSLLPNLLPKVQAITQAYIFPQGISALGVTETEKGLSTRSLLVAMPFGGLYAISKRILDARRPLEMTPDSAEEMLLPYRPELVITSEDFVNYNQSVYKIRAFRAAPSGLESTSLVFAYGFDFYFTRLTPSGTFDILKDDFDHLLISLVLISLIVSSVIFRKLRRSYNLKQAWA